MENETPLLSLEDEPNLPKLDLTPPFRIDDDPDILNSKIGKFNDAYGDDSPGTDQIKANLLAGAEGDMRAQLKATVELRRTQALQGYVESKARLAALEGREVSQEEYQGALTLQSWSLPSEAVVLEQEAARKALEPTREGTPDGIDKMLEDMATNAQIANTLKREMDEKAKAQSWGSWGLDTAKSIVPFYDYLKLGTDDGSGDSDNWGVGSAMHERARRLRQLPPAEFEKAARAEIDALAADNIPLAVELADMLADPRMSKANMRDVMEFANVAGVIPATKLGGAAGKAAGLSSAKKATAEIMAHPKVTASAVKVTQGDFEGAVNKRVLDELTPVTQAPSVHGPSVQQVDPVKQLTTFSDNRFFDRLAPDTLTNVATKRILDQVEVTRSYLKEATEGGLEIQAFTPEQLAAAFKKNEESIPILYKGNESAILDVQHVEAQVGAMGAVDYTKVILGTKGGKAFVGPDAVVRAENYAQKTLGLKSGDFQIETSGGSHYITTRIPVRDDTAVSKLLDDQLTSVSKTKLGAMVDILRNPYEYRSQRANDAATVMTFGSSKMMNNFIEAARPITQLSKSERSGLMEIMKDAQKVIRTKRGELETGRFYDTAEDLQKAYLKKFNRLPSENEVLAYNVFREISDFDYRVRNLKVWSDKTRLGLEQSRMTVDGKQTGWFESRTVPDLPGGSHYVAFRSKDGKLKSGWTDGKFVPMKDIREGIASGKYKVREVSDDAALRETINTKGARINYIIDTDFDTKALSANQLPYQEAGHIINPSTGFYLKRANVGYADGRRSYNSDTTFRWFADEASRDAELKVWEEARRILKESPAELSSYLARHIPDVDEKQFKEFLKDGNDVPFVAVKPGEKAGTYSRLQERFNEPVLDESSGLRGQIFSEFTQERSLQQNKAVVRAGTEDAPLISTSPVPTLDPMVAVAEGLTGIVQSRYLDTFKRGALQDWVQQFSHLMAGDLRTIRNDPLAFMQDPKWLEAAGSPQELMAAKTSMKSLRHLLNQHSDELWTIRTNLKDVFSKVLGPEAIVKDPWEFSKKTDVGTTLRSVGVHTKLGMFNPVQFIQQSMGSIHVLAVDGNPIRAAQAGFLTWAHQARGLIPGANREAMGAFSKALAKSVGLDEKLIDEIMEGYVRSGMNIVGGEHARIDKLLDPKVFQTTKGGKILDAGLIPFTRGNEVHRSQAYFTAHLRWRQMNPGKTITAKDMSDIMSRADLYNLNMTRAASTPLIDSGVASWMAQFTKFHRNLMDQLLGKRLTHRERAQIFGVYAGAFGVPTATGLAVAGVWPIQEQIDKWVVENGYTSSDWQKLARHGIPQYMLSAMTGEDWGLSARHAPNGIPLIKDILEDGLTWESLTGPSGNIIGETVSSFAPVLKWALSPFADDDEYYPLTVADASGIAKNISSWSNFTKAWWAMETGKFMTRAGRVETMVDGDAIDGVLIGIFGLSPQEVLDGYTKTGITREINNAKSEILKSFKEDYRRAIQAAEAGDQENADAFMKRAQAQLKGAGYTSAERKKHAKAALKENAPRLEKTNKDFQKALDKKLKMEQVD